MSLWSELETLTAEHERITAVEGRLRGESTKTKLKRIHDGLFSTGISYSDFIFVKAVSTHLDIPCNIAKSDMTCDGNLHKVIGVDRLLTKIENKLNKDSGE